MISDNNVQMIDLRLRAAATAPQVLKKKTMKAGIVVLLLKSLWWTFCMDLQIFDKIIEESIRLCFN